MKNTSSPKEINSYVLIDGFKQEFSAIYPGLNLSQKGI